MHLPLWSQSIYFNYLKFSMRHISIFWHLSTYSIIFYISMDSWMFLLYFGLYPPSPLLLKSFQLWPFGALLVGYVCVCVCTHLCTCVCLSISLFSNSTRCSRIILGISCPSPTINNFSQRALFLFLREWYEKLRSEQ